MSVRKWTGVLLVVMTIGAGIFGWYTFLRVIPEEILSKVATTEEVLVLRVYREYSLVSTGEWGIIYFDSIVATEADLLIDDPGYIEIDARFWGPWASEDSSGHLGIHPEDNGPSHFTPFMLNDKQAYLLIGAVEGDCISVTYQHYDVTDTRLDTEGGRARYSRVLSEITAISCTDIDIKL